jgi:AcrR family transcriptional regulator
VRQEVLSHARSLLDEEGMYGFSMRRLAARVGVTATALYFHFKDKEEILRELVAEERHLLRRALEEPASNPDHLTRLRLMFATALEFAIRRQDRFRMFAGDGTRDRFPVPSTGRGDVDTDPHAFFCHHIQQAIDAGTFHPAVSDPKLIGQMLWAGLHGVISFHSALGHDPWFDWRPMRQTAMRLFEMNLSGLVHGLLDGGLDDGQFAEKDAGRGLDGHAKRGDDFGVGLRAGDPGGSVLDADA